MFMFQTTRSFKPAFSWRCCRYPPNRQNLKKFWSGAQPDWTFRFREKLKKATKNWHFLNSFINFWKLKFGAPCPILPNYSSRELYESLPRPPRTTQHMRQHGKIENFSGSGGPEINFLMIFPTIWNFKFGSYFWDLWVSKSSKTSSAMPDIFQNAPESI